MMTYLSRHHLARLVILLFVLQAPAIGCHHKTLPAYGKVPDFQLISQDGKPITRAMLRHQVWVAGFIFTRCPSICPLLTARTAELQTKLKTKNLDIQLISFSVDPDYDTPARLLAYGKEHHADFDRWTFVTGNSEALQSLIVKGFKQALGAKQLRADGKEDILHSTRWVLVDAQGQIRGFYRSDPASMATLITDASALKSE